MKSHPARNFLFHFFLPLIGCILLMPFAETLDLAASSLAFDQESLSFHPPDWCAVIYIWGLIPGQALFFISAIAILIGALRTQFRSSPYWISSIYLFLALSIGSGLIAHGFFKDHFKRPRPKQVDLFGGSYPYSRPFTPYSGELLHPEDRLRSMPSGHATMGYYFFSLYFLGRRYARRTMQWAGMGIGLSLGMTLSISRVLEGGHFITDGIASCLIMWYTCLLLDLIWSLVQDKEREHSALPMTENESRVGTKIDEF